MDAMSFKEPPHWEQCSILISNTRLRKPSLAFAFGPAFAVQNHSRQFCEQPGSAHTCRRQGRTRIVVRLRGIGVDRRGGKGTLPAWRPHVIEVRQTGMILAIELVKDKAHRVPYRWQERRRRIVYVHGLSRGVLLRPLGDVIYFMPPYVITEDEIRFMAEAATEGIERATAE